MQGCECKTAEQPCCPVCSLSAIVLWATSHTAAPFPPNTPDHALGRADPLYFDFISFSQYSTISREMQRPLSVFSEYVEVCAPGAGEDDPCEAGKQVVRRPAQFADDAQLPQYFFNTAGACVPSNAAGCLGGVTDGWDGWMGG